MPLDFRRRLHPVDLNEMEGSVVVHIGRRRSRTARRASTAEGVVGRRRRSWAVAVGKQDAVGDGDADEQHEADERAFGKVSLGPENAQPQADDGHRHAQHHHERHPPRLEDGCCDEKDEKDRLQKYPSKGLLHLVGKELKIALLDLIASGHRKAFESAF